MSAAADDHRYYTLVGKPQKTGYFNLSWKATLVTIAVFLLMLVFMLMHKLLMALGVLVVGGILVGLMTWTYHGRSYAELAQIFVQQIRRSHQGQDVYIAGPESTVPGGRNALPGLQAVTELLETTDAEGRDFGVIVDLPARRATVCFSMALSGEVPRTLSERNAATDQWGAWLAQLSLSNDIASSVFVVSNRPATGALIHREVNHLLDPNAPEVARRIVLESAEELGSGVPEIEAHVALTLKINVSGASDRGFLRQIEYRLPQLYRSLSYADINAEPMTAEAITARVLSFNFPDTESDLENLSVMGEDHGVDWTNAGPSVAVEMGNHLFHDGVRTVSYEMMVGPPPTFREGTLRDLLAPHPRLRRKRVALIYQPIPASEGGKKVEKEWIDARNQRSGMKARASGAADIRVEQTDAARRAVANGAQLGHYSLMMSVTGGHDMDLDAVHADVREISGQTNIQLLPMNGLHDVGAQITQGVGVLPFGKSTVSGWTS